MCPTLFGCVRRSGAPLAFGRINTDRNPRLAKTFGVHNVPFLGLLPFGEWHEPPSARMHHNQTQEQRRGRGEASERDGEEAGEGEGGADPADSADQADSADLVIRAPERYGGYGAFSPAAEWLNNLTGLSVPIKPYVEEVRTPITYRLGIWW